MVGGDPRQAGPRRRAPQPPRHHRAHGHAAQLAQRGAGGRRQQPGGGRQLGHAAPRAGRGDQLPRPRHRTHRHRLAAGAHGPDLRAAAARGPGPRHEPRDRVPGGRVRCDGHLPGRGGQLGPAPRAARRVPRGAAGSGACSCRPRVPAPGPGGRAAGGLVLAAVQQPAGRQPVQGHLRPGPQSLQRFAQLEGSINVGQTGDFVCINNKREMRDYMSSVLCTQILIFFLVCIFSDNR